MSSISEKGAASPSSAKPMKIMATDPDRLHMSRDQSIAKDRKLREIDAKLELERQRLEALSNQEENDLVKAGSEDDNEESQAKEEEIAALKAELESLKKQKEEEVVSEETKQTTTEE